MITPEVLDLNVTIVETLKMLQRLIGENVDLSWQPAEALWPVEIDPVQLDQILANLAINARDAIDKNGNLTIRTANVELDDEDCRDVPGLAPGDYVLLSVSDDGSGMDDKVAEQIFEPFFTTKPEGLGTGLGLSTVYGIVKQNNGFIRVDSEPGAGSTFNIYLPRYRTAAMADTDRQYKESIESGSETILLVEDERALLKLARRVLENLGYNVISTDSPGEAIELAERHADSIRLLMTDLVMPEMNGHELYKRIHRSVPHIKPLFTSGYTATIHHALVEEGQMFLQKPYSSTTLSNKVREALDS